MPRLFALLCLAGLIAGAAVRHASTDEYEAYFATEGAALAKLDKQRVPVQLFRMVAQDGMASHYFGVSISITAHGSRIAVGDPCGEVGGIQSGSVYVFDGTNGNTLIKLSPMDGAELDFFGWSVSISADGSQVAVGAYLNDGSGIDSGSAYLFDGKDGRQLLKLLAEDGAANDHFGTSISISADGSRVVVGTISDDDKGLNSGSAYLFDGSSGKQLFKFLAEDGDAHEHFGTSVAIDSNGSRVVVGAYYDDEKGYHSGSAYLFDGSSGKQLFKFVAEDGAESDHFGWSVGISANGRRVVVGAYYDDDKGSNSGSAYLFEGSSGKQLFKLLAEDGGPDDHFGISVSISSDGSLLAVGAYYDDDVGIHSGSAYLFDGGSGNQLFKLIAGDGEKTDDFGRCVSITTDGSRVQIGAQGSSYLFEVPPPSASPSALNLPAQAAGDPHVTNLLGRSFDVKRPGAFTLVQLPKEGVAALKVDSLIQSVGNACSLFITEVNITGLLLDGDSIRVRASRRNAYQSHHEEPILFSLQTAPGEPWIPLSSIPVGEEALLRNYSLGGLRAEIRARRDPASADHGTADTGDSAVNGFFIINLMVPRQPLHTQIKLAKRRAWMNVHIARLGMLGYSQVGGVLGTAEPDNRWLEPTRACERHMAGADAPSHVSLLHVDSAVREEGCVAQASL